MILDWGSNWWNDCFSNAKQMFYFEIIWWWKQKKRNGHLYKIIYIVLVHFPEYKKAIATWIKAAKTFKIWHFYESIFCWIKLLLFHKHTTFKTCT